MKEKGPDRLFCNETDKPIYDELRKDGPFKGKELIDIFMMAMAIGLQHKNRVELTKKKDIILFKSFEGNEEKPMSIIKAIAINEIGNLDILLDRSKLFSIAEEYAAGGIKMLRDKLNSVEHGGYIRQLENELIKLVEKNNIC